MYYLIGYIMHPIKHIATNVNFFILMEANEQQKIVFVKKTSEDNDRQGGYKRMKVAEKNQPSSFQIRWGLSSAISQSLSPENRHWVFE